MRRLPCSQRKHWLSISIHAPLAGCDLQITKIRRVKSNFNPRTPCGVRPMISLWLSLRVKFQSTHPLRGATQAKLYSRRPFRHFNPRTPCGVRQGKICIIDVIHDISIHAPLAGCDSHSLDLTSGDMYFNPRTPCGVRQQNCRNIPGKFAQKLQNFCKAEQRAALPRVGQRESGCYFRPCAVRTSRGKPEHFRFASDNERALRSVARLCAEVLDAGFILVSKVIKA